MKKKIQNVVNEDSVKYRHVSQVITSNTNEDAIKAEKDLYRYFTKSPASILGSWRGALTVIIVKGTDDNIKVTPIITKTICGKTYGNLQQMMLSLGVSRTANGSKITYLLQNDARDEQLEISVDNNINMTSLSYKALPSEIKKFNMHIDESKMKSLGFVEYFDSSTYKLGATYDSRTMFDVNYFTLLLRAMGVNDKIKTVETNWYYDNDANWSFNPFGDYVHKKAGNSAYYGHLGFDLSHQANVQAIASGVVVSIHYDAGEQNGYYGRILTVVHNDEDKIWYSFYGHIAESSDNPIAVGDTIKAGDVIGEISNLGIGNTGAHVHIGLYANAVNATEYVVNPKGYDEKVFNNNIIRKIDEEKMPSETYQDDRDTDSIYRDSSSHSNIALRFYNPLVAILNSGTSIVNNYPTYTN